VYAAEAESFDKAVKALRAAATHNRPFDVAVIDGLIDDRHGLELARTIRNDETIAGVRLILVCTFGQRLSEKELKDSGFQASLMKPVRRSELYDCLVTLTTNGAYSSTDPSLPESRSNAHPEIDEANSYKAQVLVVEDNTINQEVARYQLEKMGYRVDVAKDGSEALAMLQRNDYALVLMDCHMPQMDGFETTARIRSRADDKALIPIIAVTASGGAGERDKCLQAGMDDFLLKPFRTDELSDKITKWLPSAAPREPAGKSSDALSESTDDMRSGLKQLEEDYGKEMAARIVGMFIPDAEARLAQIERAIKHADCRALEEAAHGLKSGAANIGATEMAQLCEQLETQGEIGDMGEASTIMKKLSISWTRVRSVVTQYRAGLE
jgi:CheY-like chemotaxis protein